MLDPIDYLSFIIRSFRRFNQIKEQSQLNAGLMEVIDEIISDEKYGVFNYDSLDFSLKVFPQSRNSIESLNMEDELEAITKLLLNIKEEAVSGNSFSLIPIYNGKICTSCILIKKSDLQEGVKKILAHAGQIWNQCRNSLELEQNNGRLARELGKNLHNLSVVRSIAQAVSKAQDLKHLLSLILKVAITTVNASKGFIMLENETTGKLELKVVHGLSNQDAEVKINTGEIKSASIAVGEGIQGKVMATQQPVILSDIVGDETGLMGLEGVTSSLMCVPLIMNDTCFGVIYITNKESVEPFDKEDLDVLSILASHASAVLDQARLYDLATTDELTGLNTRRYYTQRIGDEFRRAMRYQRHLALVVFDIDKFKNINDEFGHTAGDYILKEVAKILKSTIRNEVDAAIRFGGEEFVLILPETHLRGAAIVAERIRRRIEKKKIRVVDKTIKVTISGGASSYPENGAAIEELFNIADRALYTSKAQGRNMITCIPHV